MTVPLKFKYGISILEQDGDDILQAAEARPELITRLKEDHIVDTRMLHNTLKANIPAQTSARANQGDLTAEQNAAFEVVRALVAQARKSAKLAFPTQEVKLRQEFQVGRVDSQSLPDFLHMARIIEAACRTTANAAALKENGWIESDSDALESAITTLDDVDTIQEESKGRSTGATGLRNETANKLHDGLLKIQNAADLQYPESDPNNSATRIAFRLGIFPPKARRQRKAANPEATTPNTPGTP